MAKRSQTGADDPAKTDRIVLGRHVLEIENLGEAAGHIYARGGFNKKMLHDPQIAALFNKWWSELGLFEKVAAPITVDELGLAFERNTKQIVREAQDFVTNTIHLEWSWVLLDLLQLFLGETIAHAFNVELSSVWSLADATPAPPFITRADETLEEAMARMISDAMKLSQPLARGRLPKDAGAAMEEWGGWFYRARVRGESIAELAREYTKARRQKGLSIDDDNRSTVRYGIAEAEKALGLVVVAPLEK